MHFLEHTQKEYSPYPWKHAIKDANPAVSFIETNLKKSKKSLWSQQRSLHLCNSSYLKIAAG